MGNFLKRAGKKKLKITCNQEYGIPWFSPSREIIRVIWRFPTSKVQVKETAVYGVDSEGEKTLVRICWFLLRFLTVTSSP